MVVAPAGGAHAGDRRGDKILAVVVTSLIAILSLWLHEIGHALASRYWHDSFGERKLTWRPLVNLDPVLSIITPIVTALATGGSFAFGTGRPFVLVKYRWQIAAAGPMTNLILALVLLPFWRQAAYINAAIGMLNLIPLYPLDGWVIWHVLRDR